MWILPQLGEQKQSFLVGHDFGGASAEEIFMSCFFTLLSNCAICSWWGPRCPSLQAGQLHLKPPHLREEAEKQLSLGRIEKDSIQQWFDDITYHQKSSGCWQVDNRWVDIDRATVAVLFWNLHTHMVFWSILLSFVHIFSHIQSIDTSDNSNVQPTSYSQILQNHLGGKWFKWQTIKASKITYHRLLECGKYVRLVPSRSLAHPEIEQP